MNHRIFERKWRPSGHVFLSVAKPSCLLYRPQFLLRSAKTWQFVVCAFVPKGSTEEERRDNSTTAHESCVVLGSLLTVDALTERSSLSCLSLPRPCAQPRRERRYGERVFFPELAVQAAGPVFAFPPRHTAVCRLCKARQHQCVNSTLTSLLEANAFCWRFLLRGEKSWDSRGKGQEQQARFFQTPDISFQILGRNFKARGSKP